MFKLVKVRTAWWPVVFRVPTEEGGMAEEVKIEMQFRILGIDTIGGMQTAGEEIDRLNPDSSASVRMAKVLLGVVADWRGVGDETGVALALSEESLAQFLSIPGVWAALLEAYRACCHGEAELRTKN